MPVQRPALVEAVVLLLKHVIRQFPARAADDKISSPPWTSSASAASASPAPLHPSKGTTQPTASLSIALSHDVEPGGSGARRSSLAYTAASGSEHPSAGNAAIASSPS